MKSLQFKIQISDIKKPKVWRRVLVPHHITLDTFHQIIQAAFGWENRHLYQFSEKGWASRPVYKVPDEYDNDEALDSRTTFLTEIFENAEQTYTYIYDFGDDWKHIITLEKITDSQSDKPTFIAGEGACPPEDSGGPFMYSNLLNVVNDPKHADYKAMRKWLGLKKNEQLEVNAFDVSLISKRLEAVDL